MTPTKLKAEVFMTLAVAKLRNILRDADPGAAELLRTHRGQGYILPLDPWWDCLVSYQKTVARPSQVNPTGRAFAFYSGPLCFVTFVTPPVIPFVIPKIEIDLTSFRSDALLYSKVKGFSDTARNREAWMEGPTLC